MKKRANKQYAKALYDISKNLPTNKVQEVVKSFLEILQRDNKLSKANIILDEFVKYSQRQEGVNEVTVESARKLDEKAIEKLTNIFGKNSIIKEVINPDLIGGLRIKVNDTVYDASLKNQLTKLKKQLI